MKITFKNVDKFVEERQKETPPRLWEGWQKQELKPVKAEMGEHNLVELDLFCIQDGI